MTRSPAEERLAERLHALANYARVEPVRVPTPVGLSQEPRRPARRTVVVAAATVIAVVIAAGAVALTRSTSGSDRLQTTTATPAMMPSHIVGPLTDTRLGVFDARTGQFQGVAAGGKPFGTLSTVIAAPDGQSVFAIVARQQVDRCDTPTIQRIDLTTGAVTDPRGGPVGTTRGHDPAISPDGRYLAFLTCIGTREAIGLADLRNGSEFRWPTTDGQLGRPVWSSDARYLAFGEGLDRIRVTMMRRSSLGLDSTQVLRLPSSIPLATPGSSSGSELAGFLGRGRDTFLLRRVRIVPQDPQGPDEGPLLASIRKTQSQLAALPPNSPQVPALQQALQAALTAYDSRVANRNFKTDALAFDAASGEVRVLFTLTGVAQLSVDESCQHVLAVTGLGAFRWSRGNSRPSPLPGLSQTATAAWMP